MATATKVSATGDVRIDGLLDGTKWVGQVTVGFPDSASDYSATYSGSEPKSGFSAVSSELQRVLTGFVGLVRDYTNLDIRVLSTATIGDIAIAQSSLPTAKSPAYAGTPVGDLGSGRSGDIWFGTVYNFRNPRVGDYASLTAIHELGHALGLKHAHEDGGVANVSLPAAQDWLGYSVMSYRSYQGDDTDGYNNETYGYPTTYMADDILALQAMYGANYNTNSSNTTYTWSATTGQSFVNGVGGPIPGSGAGAAFDPTSNRVFMTLWDGGGEDTVDLSNFANGMNLNLTPGAGSTFTNLPNLGGGRTGANVYMSWLANGDARSVIENAKGGAGADTIIGNAADNKLWGNAGGDSLFGGAGNDLLMGGAGNDTLRGGSGFDTAVYEVTFRSAAFNYFGVPSASGLAGGTMIGIGVADGTDAVDVERAQFSDATINLADYRGFDGVAPKLLVANSIDNQVLPSSVRGTTLDLQFNEQVQMGGGNVRVYYSDGKLFQSYAVSQVFVDGFGQSLRIAYPDRDGNFYIEIDRGAVLDSAGNAFAGISGGSALNFTIGAVDDYPDLPTISSVDGSFGGNAAFNTYVATYKTIDARTITSPLKIDGYLNNTNDNDFHRVLFDPNKIYLISYDTSSVNGATGSQLLIESTRYNDFRSPGSYEIGVQTAITGKDLFKYTSGERWIGNAGSVGAYSYTISVWDGGDDYANDGLASAPATGSVQVGGSVGGILYAGGTSGTRQTQTLDSTFNGGRGTVTVADLTGGDSDWIKVDLVAGQSYRFQVSPGAAAYQGFDIDGPVTMGLYRNYTGNAAIVQTNGAPPPSLASATTPANFLDTIRTTAPGAAQFDYQATQTGTYWLRVASGFGVGAAYTVSVGTTASLPVLTPPTLVSSDISYAGGVQAFTLIFNEAIRAGDGKITIVANGVTSTVEANDASRVSWSGATATIKMPVGDTLIGQIALSYTAGSFLDTQGAQTPGATTQFGTPQTAAVTIDPLATAATAATIAVGDRVTQSITATNDSDWYRATLQAGIAYDITSFGGLANSGAAVTQLTVRNASGGLIVQDLAQTGGAGTGHLVYTPTATGTYYLDVGGSAAGTYTLQLLPFAGGITDAGTAAADYLSGTAYGDTLQGGAGGDMLDGRGGNDTLYGEGGDDLLAGGTGDDLLFGGSGFDLLYGGEGNDRFAGAFNELGGDRIADLALGERISIVDVAIDRFSYLRSGSGVSFGSQTIDIGGLVTRLVYRADGQVTDLVASNRTGNLSDFTGDGHTDLVFRNTNGSVSTWNFTGNLNASFVQQSAFNASVDSSWKIIETFDWSGDARSDILFRNDNGAVAIWRSEGSGFNQASYYHAPVATSWRIAGTGDINGDGKDDLLWQNTNGSISAWTSTGTGFAESTYNHASPGAGWRIDGMGDFNGDGKSDILWRHSNGGVATWMADGNGGFFDGGYYAGGVPTSWHIDGIGDFNGDGKDDLIWRHDDGAVSVWRSNGGGFDQGVYNNSAPTSWQVAQVGDVNGDGKADLIWRNSGGAVSTWQSNGAGFDQSVYNSSAPTAWTIEAHDFLV